MEQLPIMTTKEQTDKCVALGYYPELWEHPNGDGTYTLMVGGGDEAKGDIPHFRLERIEEWMPDIVMFRKKFEGVYDCFRTQHTDRYRLVGKDSKGKEICLIEGSSDGDIIDQALSYIAEWKKFFKKACRYRWLLMQVTTYDSIKSDYDGTKK